MDYVAHVSVWNQVQLLAKQLRHDVVHAPNHKYIAHQLALLYVRASLAVHPCCGAHRGACRVCIDSDL
jgi:hypothetical protein